jgi:hypothetical protein
LSLSEEVREQVHAKWFHLIELIVVIVILGILPRQLPRFIDLSTDARNQRRRAAGSIASGTSINFAARSAGNAAGVAVNAPTCGGYLQPFVTGVALVAVAPANDQIPDWRRRRLQRRQCLGHLYRDAAWRGRDPGQCHGDLRSITTPNGWRGVRGPVGGHDMTNGWRRAWLAAVLTIASGAAGAATYANTATTFAWIDASSHAQVGYNTVPYKFNGTLGSSVCGTVPPVIDDTISDIIPLGFSFFYGDRTFDGVRIMSNGRLQFVSSSPVYDNTTCGYGSPVTQLPIPNAGLNYTMRIFGNDLDPTLKSDAAGCSTSCTSRTGANACFVSCATIGASPNRRFVATWNNVPEWAAASTTTGSYNIQIIVQEDGDFIYQFGADVPGPGATTGQVGWQVSATDYEAPSVGYPAPNTAVRFFTPHPVLEYRMEESTWSGTGQVVDSSGGNRHGNPVGAAQTTAFGKVCRGADIPAAGNNAIDTATPLASIGNAGMVAFWYKANTAWSGAGTQDVQLLDATTVNNQWFFLVRRGGTGANAGKLRFVVTDSANNVRVAETPALAVAANTWKHVAVTWTFNNLTGGNNDRLRIYVDGVLQTTTAFTSTTLTLSPQLGTLYLGGSRRPGRAGPHAQLRRRLIDENVFNYEAPASKVAQA